MDYTRSSVNLRAYGQRDPLNEYKQLTQIPELPDWALPSASMSRWEDVAELELAKQKELEDDTESIEDKKQKIKEQLDENN